MPLHHLHKVPVGLHPHPLELRLPVGPEAPGAALVAVVPEVAEGLLEQVRLEKLRARRQHHIERRPGLAPDPGPAGHQDELLARERLLQAPKRAAHFSLADLVEGVVEMPHHVELVVDDLHAGTMRPEAFGEGLAHIHDGVGDERGALLAEPAPETLKPLLGAAFDDVQQLGAARSFQRADQRPVLVPLAHADLVDAQHRYAVQGPGGLDLLQSGLVDILHGVPVQIKEQGGGLDRGDLAELMDKRAQGAGDPGAAHVGELQGLRAHAASWTGHPVTLEMQGGLVPPEGQVPQFLPAVVVSLGNCLAATATDVSLPRPFQMDADKRRSGAELFYGAHAVALNSEQFCEIIFLHPERPSCLRHRKFTASGALFSSIYTHTFMP